MKKKCFRCKEEKSLKEFYRNRTQPSGYQTQCKACRQEHRYNEQLKDKYGISIEEYNTLYHKQGGVCGICHGKCSRSRLSVDHCHETGRIRGLLCAKCNRGLGFFNDNPVLIKRAIKWLVLPSKN